MKRRPFFLIEVVIAAFLVGGFAFLSIREAFHLIHKQKKLLKDIESLMEVDRKRMKTVETCWNNVEAYEGKKYTKIKDCFPVRSRQSKDEKYYLLKVQGDKSGEQYCYLVDLLRN